MASRAARLIGLLEALRRRRRPVSAAALAAQLGVSVRTVYRDIVELRAQGAEIDGDAGVGYVLRDGHLLPALHFSRDELEALLLGMRWVAGQADVALAVAAGSALARISASLSPTVRTELDTAGLFVPTWDENRSPEPWLPILRRAIREEHALRMDYVDADGRASARVVWPFAMAFYDPLTRTFAAWCELRGDFRHFRADRVRGLAQTGQRYPERRHALIRRWRAMLEKEAWQGPVGCT